MGSNFSWTLFSKFKEIRTILLILLLFLSGCTSVTQNLPKEIPDNVIQSYAVVGTSRNKGSDYKIGRHGAGTIIGFDRKRTYILTAKHVVKLEPPRKNCTILLKVCIDNFNNCMPAKVEREWNGFFDMAIVSTRKIKRAATEVNWRGPSRGERVFVLGSPRGTFRQIYRRRVVKETNGLRGRLQYLMGKFELDGDILPGFSGGGIFSADGKLIGVNLARTGTERSKGIGISTRILWKVKKWMSHHLVQED